MITIAGYGFVGKAYAWLFQQEFEVKIVDPKYNSNKIDQDTSSVVCCVPTPEGLGGSCDMKYIIDVIQTTPSHSPILIKSTISLEGWDMLLSKFPEHKLCFSPEFLRAASAMEDIKKMDSIILSGEDNYWQEQFKLVIPKINIIELAAEEAILVKYFCNSYLATKLSYFNELFDFCQVCDINFDNIRNIIGSDSRIGDSHTYVKLDIQRGWTGSCFPKDTKALLKMAEKRNVRLSTLEAAVTYNNKIVSES